MGGDVRRAIAWFRRDLRLSDNRTLEAATAMAERVWPVFVADPAPLAAHRDAPGRVAWFGANLRALDEALHDRGSGLTVLCGRPEDVLPAFAASVGAEVVLAGADEDPVAIQREERVARSVRLTLVDDQRIVPPGRLRTHAGEPYAVYTPFRRALDAIVDEDRGLIAAADADLGRLAPAERPGGSPAFPVVTVPHALPEPGETAATERLRTFLRAHVAGYREAAARPTRRSRRGETAARAIRSSMPACGSSWPRVGCTTAPGW